MDTLAKDFLQGLESPIQTFLNSLLTILFTGRDNLKSSVIELITIKDRYKLTIEEIIPEVNKLLNLHGNYGMNLYVRANRMLSLVF